MADQENIHSIGGHARAEKLSRKHRSQIASKAASIRWQTQQKPQASLALQASSNNKGKLKHEVSRRTYG